MNSSAATPTPAFDLRCREAEWIDQPQSVAQTLAEFGRPAPLVGPRRFAGLAEVLVADTIARNHLEIDELARGRVILSCELPRHGIPLGVRELDRPPVDDWKLREELRGELLDAGPGGGLERSLSMQVRRGLIAVAGALPLLASPVLAHASPASQMAAAQLLAFAPPALPKEAEPAAGDTEASESSESSESTTAAPATTTAAPATTASPPAPRVGGSLTMSGTALWEGLLGKEVRLEMKSGDALAGTIVAQSSSDLALARAPDGVVVAVPKSEVGSVRMRPSSAAAGGGGSNIPVGERPLQDGRGLSSGGIVMVTLGSIVALSGTVMLAISPYYLFISLPLLLPGLAMIGGGSGMIAVAGKKKRAFDKAWGIPSSARVELTPTLGGGRNGASAGLVLRF